MKEKFVLTRGMLILAVLIILLIVGGVFGTMKIMDKGKEKYRNYEKVLEIAGEDYYEMVYLEKNDPLEEDANEIFTMKELLASGSLDSNEDVSNLCTGYVVVENQPKDDEEGYEIVYSGKIKCGKKYISLEYYNYEYNE